MQLISGGILEIIEVLLPHSDEEQRNQLAQDCLSLLNSILPSPETELVRAPMTIGFG